MVNECVTYYKSDMVPADCDCCWYNEATLVIIAEGHIVYDKDVPAYFDDHAALCDWLRKSGTLDNLGLEPCDILEDENSIYFE